LIETSLDTIRTTISFLLMRWHGYTVANAWMDCVLAELGRVYAKLSRTLPGNALATFLEQQESVIKVVGATTLLLQDPITHRTSSGSSFVLYNAGSKKLRLSELSHVVEPKLRTMVYYFETLAERIRRKQVAQMERRADRRLRGLPK
jgi:hypothetical protein